MIKATLHSHVLEFNFTARTSRGEMKDKTSWFIKIWDDKSPDFVGVGECAPLPGLSVDYSDTLPKQLQVLVKMINLRALIVSDLPTDVSDCHAFINQAFPLIDFQLFPSMAFAIESALLDLASGGKQQPFQGSFLQGTPIPINGLIWMGHVDFMLEQVNFKLKAGFNCLKLKIGGINFDKECDVLRYIRKRYYRNELTIRLDANGSFKGTEAIEKLTQLSDYDIHSIEQPIKPNDPAWKGLCEQSPIPIALDESLIGVGSDQRQSLLEEIKPSYIILKPTLHGGLYGCAKWIELAKANHIDWWITSALESSIGLNTIAQFTSTYAPTIPQGLGTGQIFLNTFASPLSMENGKLVYAPDGVQELPQ